MEWIKCSCSYAAEPLNPFTPRVQFVAGKPQAASRALPASLRGSVHRDPLSTTSLLVIVIIVHLVITSHLSSLISHIITSVRYYAPLTHPQAHGGRADLNGGAH